MVTISLYISWKDYLSPADYHFSSTSRSSGGAIGPVRCPEDHILKINCFENDIECRGWPDDNKCQRGSLPPALRPISYKCLDCNYDLCPACYEAKSQGMSDGVGQLFISSQYAIRE